ncbi:Unknown protein, partial [Striga hermonthica]
ARQLKNTASRAYHARKRHARAMVEVRALERSARETGEDRLHADVRAVCTACMRGVGGQDVRSAGLMGARAERSGTGEARAADEATCLEACGKAGDAE